MTCGGQLPYWTANVKLCSWSQADIQCRSPPLMRAFGRDAYIIQFCLKAVRGTHCQGWGEG